jgi:hypothetical protein
MCKLYPTNFFRFGRLFRWMGWLVYSSEMRKAFIGIFYSTRSLLIFTIFFCMFLVIFAYIGLVTINDYDGQIHYDRTNDFTSLLNIIHILYSMTVRDFYP